MAVNINVPSQVKTYANLAAFPATGALKTIYIAEDTNKTYRWTGSVYVEVSAAGASGITIGSTAIASGVVGRVLFEGAGNVVQESSSLFWDATNNRLGIGTSTPSNTLDVVGVAKFNQSGTSVILNNPSGRYTDLAFANADSIKSFVSLDNSQFYLDLFNATNYGLRLWTNNAERMRIPTTGNVLIGTTTDAGFRLDVNGTARVQGNTTIVASGATLNINPTADTQITALYLNNTAGALRTSLYQNLSSGESRLWAGSGQFLTIWSQNAERIRIINGNTLINTTTDAGFRLDVNGTARVSGNLAFVTGNTYINSTSNHMWIAAVTSTSTDIQMIPGRQVNINNTGTYTAQASAILQTDSTTKGFLPPRMTTTQKNAIASPAAGLVVYDTTLNKLCVYTTAWETVTSL